MEVVVPDEFKELYSAGPILKVPNATLRARAQPVQKIGKRVLDLIDTMQREMRKARGIGLAAPQLGRLERIIIIAPQGMRPAALINPTITRFCAEKVVGEEGCLSIPGLYGDVERAAMVKVSALDRRGRHCEYVLEGLPARVAQHEIDHLDGVLFVDKADPATLHWRNPEAEPTPLE